METGKQDVDGRGGVFSPGSPFLCPDWVRRIRRIRHGFSPRLLFACCLVSLSGTRLFGGAEADVFPDPSWQDPVPAALNAPSESLAAAHARYILGIFAEENSGPESALVHFDRVLELDPGFFNLATAIAQEALRRGDTARAIGIMKDTAKARPADPLPELVLGEIYLRHLQRTSLAVEHTREALRLDPDNFAGYELLWEIHQFAGQSRQATAILEEAAAQSTTDPRFWMLLAEFHRRLPLLENEPLPADTLRRRLALEKVTELAADDPELLIRAADLHALHRETAEAADLYEKAFAFEPEREGLRDKLAAALIGTGRGQEAVPLLEESLRIHPANLEVCDILGTLAAERGDGEELIRQRQRALALAPRDFGRHHELIDLLLQRQKYELALHYLEEAMNRFPHSGLFPYIRGATLTRSGRAADAIPYFDQALAESALVRHQYVGGEFYFEFGMAAEQAGLYERAAELFKKAIDIDPANAARACNYLGYMWVERNENLTEAEDLIRRALEAEPNNGAYLDSLGWLHYRRGQYAQALVLLLRASELLPEPDSVVYEHIADTYRALGRLPEALLYWQKALVLDPENIGLVEKIETISARTAMGQLPSASAP
jgi:tetratricopeptide (TPR) repeat protein